MAEEKALAFVSIDEESGQFRVEQRAVELLSTIKGQIVVIAVAGLYRTGKSFLLNLLVQNNMNPAQLKTPGNPPTKNAGFAVGGTVQACTKGIWMWGKPILLDDGSHVIFLDTEGLGSIDREQNHDSRLFALALLLASYFIYNSRGVIDGNAIDDLSLVVNLSKHIQTSSKSSSINENNSNEFHEYFPSFLWIVRDFTLKLLDNGKKISSKQYLENALKPASGFGEGTTSKNHIRKLLTDFFRQRDCVTLVRPAEDEEVLRNLQTTPYEELREEFRSTFESMKEKIYTKAQPKTLFGNVLNGAMFAKLAQTYCETLNTGKAPVISSAWSRVVEGQCADAAHEATEIYKNEMSRIINLNEKRAIPENKFESSNLANESLDELEVTNGGQGGHAEFDENGNLRLKVSSNGDEYCKSNSESTMGDEKPISIDDLEMLDYKPIDENPITNEEFPCSSVIFPVEEEMLKTVHKYCKKKAKHFLEKATVLQHPEMIPFLDTFVDTLREELKKYSKKNASASLEYCKEILIQHHQRLTGDVQKSSTTGTETLSMDFYFNKSINYLDDLSNFKDEYAKIAIGPSQDAAFCDFFTKNMFSTVIQYAESSSSLHTQQLNEMQSELNKELLMLAQAEGQAAATSELVNQEIAKSELAVKDAERDCKAELDNLQATLEYKTAELEHVTEHIATLKKLADTAQQTNQRASVMSSTLYQGDVYTGYLIKQDNPFSKWQQRFFVLHKDKLEYFKTKDEFERGARPERLGVALHGAVLDERNVHTNQQVPESFQLSFANQTTLTMVAKSNEMKTEWVGRLRRAIESI